MKGNKTNPRPAPLNTRFKKEHDLRWRWHKYVYALFKYTSIVSDIRKNDIIGND